MKISEIYKKKNYVRCPDGTRHKWEWGGNLGPWDESFLGEAKMQKSHTGFGMTQYDNTDFVLARGFRSGNSGPGTTRLKYIVYDRKLVDNPNDIDKAKTFWNKLGIEYSSKSAKSGVLK